MEIASLALAIPPLLVGIRKCVKLFAEIRDGFNGADDKISVLITQCELLETALGQAQEIARHVPATHLASVTADCSKAIEGMEALLAQFGVDVGNPTPLAMKARLGFAMKEDDLKPVLERLDRCHRNLETYLGIIRFEYLQMSLSGKSTALTKAGRRGSSIIQSDTNSITFSFLSENSRFSTTALYINQDRRSAVSMEFDFDALIQSTMAYRRLCHSNGSNGMTNSSDLAPVGNSTVQLQPYHTAVEAAPVDPNAEAPSSTPENKTVNFPIFKGEKNLQEIRSAALQKNRDADREFPSMLHRLLSRGRSRTSNVDRKICHIAVLGGAQTGAIAFVQSFLDQRNGPRHANYHSSHLVRSLIDSNFTSLYISKTSDMPKRSLARARSIVCAEAILLLYNTTSRSSFEELNVLYREIYYLRRMNNLPIVVVGHQLEELDVVVDGASGGVPPSEGSDWAARHKGVFLEASVITGWNVHAAFYSLVQEITMKRSQEKSQ